MERQQKESLRQDLGGRFQKANAVIVAEYRGLTVAELTELRVQLREGDGEFRVIPNRIAKKAIELDDPEATPLSDSLKGPVGVAYLYGDPAQGAKTVLEFAKNNEKFIVKAGLLESKAVDANELKALASLPSKEALMGQIVGSLVAPHRGLLGVMNGVSRNLVQVLNAIKDKKA